jgi:SAM-dependent methyltransferase
MQENLLHKLKRAFYTVRRTEEKKPSGSHHSDVPAVGKVSMGDLRRVSAISTRWGCDRGMPVDRPYISAFIERHKSDIHGQVLEVKEPTYAGFGGDAVVKLDIVDVDRENARADIFADLCLAPQIPTDTYDCIILTQVLPVIFDVHSVIGTLYRILKPGGVLLLTVPGPFSPPFPGDACEHFYWAFYPRTVKALLEQRFVASHTTVDAYGNLATCAAFIAGMSFEDLSRADYESNDVHYPLIISARAVK